MTRKTAYDHIEDARCRLDEAENWIASARAAIDAGQIGEAATRANFAYAEAGLANSALRAAESARDKP